MATKTINKQTCKCCGQSVNPRKIALNKTMVMSLKKVYNWCQQHNRHEFSRAEVKHLFTTESETAHFGNWVHFGGIFYKREKGQWGLSMERAAFFLEGRLIINLSFWYDPIARTYTPIDRGTIHSVKGILASMDASGNYIVEYK